MRRLIYSIYVVLVAIPLLLITLLTSLVTILGCWLGKSSFWGYYPGKIWSVLVCYLLLLRVHVERKQELQKNQSYVFVGNHQGTFDIFLVYGFLGRNFKWMIKHSIRKMPFIGPACQSAQHIFVDRRGPRKVYQSIQLAKKILCGGISLMIFPEGARTFTGHMGYFKKGAFQLADELQLPVVPVTINGSFDVLPRDKRWIRQHRLELIIHAPIYPIAKGEENVQYLLEQSYAAIQTGLPQHYKGMVRNEDQDVIS